MYVVLCSHPFQSIEPPVAKTISLVYRNPIHVQLWSVTFVDCGQTAEDIDTISFAYDSPMFLPDLVKIWLRPYQSMSPFFPNFDPN